MLAEIVSVKIGQNAPLMTQSEAVVPVVDCQITNVVRDHAVEPANAVLAGDANLAVPSQVEHAGPGQERAQFGLRISKAQDGLGAVVSANRCLFRSEPLIEGCLCHVRTFDYSQAEKGAQFAMSRQARHN